MADPEKLSQQPLAQEPGSESDFFYSVQNGQTRRMPRSILRTAILSAWQGFVRNFLAAADESAARTAIGAAAVNADTTGSAAKWTTARNFTLTGHATGTIPIDGSADVALPVTINRKVAADYITGLQLQWVSANALTVSAGAAYIPGSSSVVTALTAIAKTGLVLAANSKFHVYLYDNAGTPDIEIVATAPSAKTFGNVRTKTGDTSRRYIGSIFTGAANTIYRFKHLGQRIFYLVNFAAAPFEVLTNATAVVSTAVSFAGCVPETAVSAQVIMLATHTNAASVFVNDADVGAVTASNGTASIGLTNSYSVDLTLSAAQALNYIYTVAPTGGGFYLRVQAYTFER